MQISDGDLEKACRAAADASVAFILEVAAGYVEADKEVGIAELVAILAGDREAVVTGAKERAFQAVAELVDPERFRIRGSDDDED